MSNTLRMPVPRVISQSFIHRISRPWSAYSRHVSGQAVENFPQWQSRRRALVSACHAPSRGLEHQYREPQQFARRNISSLQNDEHAKKRHAFIALGSNMGDRAAMIEQACKEMESGEKIRIIRTSSLWESKAMYVLDQDNFVNGVCEVCPPCFCTVTLH